MKEQYKKIPEEPKGLIVGIVREFLTGPLSILLIIASLLLGVAAVMMTPREEEPQIVVPMIDIAVNYPGHTPEEVEKHVTIPLERLLWQIDGVEHVYSGSMRDKAMVTVRFYVGENREDSIVKVNEKISRNLDIIPMGVKSWKVTNVEIDDVPVVTLTLFSQDKTPYELRRIAEELKSRLDWLQNLSLTEIIGGYPRQIKIYPNIEKMEARKVSLQDIANALVLNNSTGRAGNVTVDNTAYSLIVERGLMSVWDINQSVVKTSDNGLVRISDIAEVVDGPTEQDYYASIGFGPSSPAKFTEYRGRTFPAVTLSFSKKKGTNAVTVAENVIQEAEKLKGVVLPDDVHMVVTRNYGKTADAKVNNLLSSLLFAIITVVALIAVTMGWKEGMVVGLSVPVSFSLALFVNYISGYTINRVTLFALILSLGMVVDDPITNVDNIQRHIRIGLLNPMKATIFAVHEVIPPVIMSTLAIIVSFTPMFFITGMMGPYMGPMAINVPLTVTFSTVCALTFVPWLSLKLLKNKGGELKNSPSGDSSNTAGPFITKIYHAAMRPFLKKRNAVIMLFSVVLLLFGSAALMLFKVPLKMLPFDNKDELQLILEMPEGTSLETTENSARSLASYLQSVPEVRDYEIYTGVNAPIDFNGLVRHYGMRRNANQADIRINLRDKNLRKSQSHAIALRIRDKLTEIAGRDGGIVSVVEVPPGPPVMSTLTPEVFGASHHSYADLIAGAKELENVLRKTDSKNIQQIDDMSEAPHKDIEFNLQKDEAMINGLRPSVIYDTLQTALAGRNITVMRNEYDRNPLYVNLRLPLTARSDTNRLGQLWIPSPSGNSNVVQLQEIGDFSKKTAPQPIYHKDLRRTVFVTAETVGRPPGEIIVQMLLKNWKRPVTDFFNAAISEKWIMNLSNGIKAEWGGEGEWQITVRVFRDLGLAFAAALAGIYLLLILQTKSFFMPLIIMCAIPLTIIGIAPGFYLLNLIAEQKINGYSDPVFFTATGMIGMIALGGIVIRNSVVLIDFIENALSEGKELKSAILDSGAVRFRPIVLTAITTMIGAWPITFDPVFSGLAWALIFGLIASTMFTLIVVPAVYCLIKRSNV
jgi:multidrug efflux pump subunit AcrB